MEQKRILQIQSSVLYDEFTLDPWPIPPYIWGGEVQIEPRDTKN